MQKYGEVLWGQRTEKAFSKPNNVTTAKSWEISQPNLMSARFEDH